MIKQLLKFIYFALTLVQAKRVNHMSLHEDRIPIGLKGSIDVEVIRNGISVWFDTLLDLVSPTLIPDLNLDKKGYLNKNVLDVYQNGKDVSLELN